MQEVIRKKSKFYKNVFETFEWSHLCKGQQEVLKAKRQKALAGQNNLGGGGPSASQQIGKVARTREK